MFGKRFAFQFQEGWTPPWLQGDGPHSHIFKRRFGHGPFRVRTHFGPTNIAWRNRWDSPWSHDDADGPHFFAMRRGRGPFGPFGPGGDGGRLFGRGDMKFALLELLRERPMHGYEMMKAFEERSGGFYTPSPGSVYPTLQMLEDGGYVNVKEVEGKKVYSITEAGQELLAHRPKDEEGFAGPPWMRRHGAGPQHFLPEMQALRSEAAEVGRLLSIAVKMSFQNPEQLARLRSIIEHTRKDLSGMIYGASSQQSQPSSDE